MRSLCWLFPLILIVLALCISANKNKEDYYQDLIAKELGVSEDHIEFVLPDRTRIDILDKKVAYEVDFAAKWAEGIGQALHYSTMTRLEAGLVIVIEKESDQRHVDKILNIMRSKSLRIILYTFRNEKLVREGLWL